MSNYIKPSTGEVKTQGEWRLEYSNISLPRVWTAATLESLGLETVFSSAQPDHTNLQRVVSAGTTTDESGNTIEAWSVEDIFADTTVDGVTTTKAEHEAAYLAELTAAEEAAVRATRDALLAKTDYTGLKDVTMSDEMATYRQSLRDITAHANFPNLEDADWPEAP